MTPDERREWVRNETQRRLKEENQSRRAEIDEPGMFPAETGWFNGPYADRLTAGMPEGALATVIHGSCNGWRDKPSVAEARNAIRRRKRETRADSIAWTIATESSERVIMAGEARGEYSLQDLAWWIRELNIPCYRRINWLNTMGRAWRRQQQVGRETAGDIK